MGSALSRDDVETLRRLEEALWRADTRFDTALMERTFAPGFFEFGRSGRVWTRGESLAEPPQPIDARLPLPKFEARAIGACVALVTYVSAVTYGGIEEFANRSSLWLRTGDGWQLQFHQGTPTKAP